MVKPHRIDLKVVTVLALGDANSHLRPFLHYNCCFRVPYWVILALFPEPFWIIAALLRRKRFAIYWHRWHCPSLLNIRKVIIPCPVDFLARLFPPFL